jgi:hypothetical protein
MTRLELFSFRYRDSRTGKWIVARYRAELHEIAARYAEFEIVGPPEVREIDRDRQRFNPHGDAVRSAHPTDAIPPRDHRPAPIPRIVDPATVRGEERFLLLLFLRRYVSYCARRRRFAAMNGAARLHAAIVGDVGSG